MQLFEILTEPVLGIILKAVTNIFSLPTLVVLVEQFMFCSESKKFYTYGSAVYGYFEGGLKMKILKESFFIRILKRFNILNKILIF